MIDCRTGWRQDAKGTGRELTTDIKAKKSVAKFSFPGAAALALGPCTAQSMPPADSGLTASGFGCLCADCTCFVPRHGMQAALIYKYILAAIVLTCYHPVLWHVQSQTSPAVIQMLAGADIHIFNHLPSIAGH